MKAISACLLALLLAGNVSAQTTVAECEAQMVANKDLQILKGKIDLLNSSNQPTEILGNTKVPSKKEKPALSLWVEEQKRCSKIGLDMFKRQDFELGTVIEQAYSEMFISAADLYQGKISYGDFARASLRRHGELKANLASVVQQRQQVQAQQQAEREQREGYEKQQAENRQREAFAQLQQQCDLMKQQILVATSNRPSPYQIQQQRQAELDRSARDYALMSAGERAAMGMSQAGAQLGQIGASLLGMQDPQMQQREAALNQMIATYKQSCQ
jgi:hypothetical protein